LLLGPLRAARFLVKHFFSSPPGFSRMQAREETGNGFNRLPRPQPEVVETAGHWIACAHRAKPRCN